jgi:1-acyl-sn-glycerol-3-phosphate acyltransferase
MTSFEEEYKKQLPTIKRLSFIALLGKRIIVKGEENFIKKGPNILVGNHIGSFKDIATLATIAPRPIFFTANKMIFTKDEFNFLIRKHAQRHLKEFGLFLDLILTPIKSIFVNYISTTIGKVGMIPVDMYGGKSLAIEQCQDHLKEGKLIVTLQGRGRVEKKGPNPYLREFKRGASIICYNLYQEGISVPVTPLAIFGTHFPFLIPTKVRVNVGEPIYIKDYLGKNFSETIERFRKAQQERVKSLLREIIHS